MSFLREASLRSIRGASPPSTFSAVSAPFVFAIPPTSKFRVACQLPQLGKPALRFLPFALEVLLLLPRALIRRITQTGRRQCDLSIKLRSPYHNVDDFPQIAPGALWVRIAALEGKGKPVRTALLL